MFSIELVLSLDVLKSLMVRMDYELDCYKLVTPMFQATDDGIEFFVIS